MYVCNNASVDLSVLQMLAKSTLAINYVHNELHFKESISTCSDAW